MECFLSFFSMSEQKNGMQNETKEHHKLTTEKNTHQSCITKKYKIIKLYNTIYNKYCINNDTKH